MGFGLTSILTALLEGLTMGSIYALVGVSFNVLYRPTNVFNFAQGELVMLGAMVGATAMAVLGVPFFGALALAAVVVAVVALVQERVAVAPVLRRSARSHSWLITTLACSMIMVNVVAKIWGGDPVKVTPPWPLSTRTFDILGIMRASSYSLALIALTILIVVGIEAVYRTRSGKAIKAIAEDREAALLRGISPDKLGRWSFILGGALAASVGLLAAPIMFASTGLGAILLLKGFEAAAIGGIGSNKGALMAGYLLGIAEALGVFVLTPGYQSAVTFVLFLAILLIKPEGFFGQPEVRHV
jgi:branched-chain amino acid transport system permease protein